MSDYCDTSLLVSLYVEDAHSADADRIMLGSSRFFLTPLHQAEWHHAITQNVFRQRLNKTQADIFLAQFTADISNTRWITAAVSDSALTMCADLARQFGCDFGMRTLDTLHVACALELKAERFWTFDERQAKLAKAAGLKTT